MNTLLKIRNIYLILAIAGLALLISGFCLSGFAKADSPLSFPSTSASALTSAPADMTGINSHHNVFTGQADPDYITLGPKYGLIPDASYYPTKRGVEFEVPRRTPVLAPMDSKFVGFTVFLISSGVGGDGTVYKPFDDMMLCFESTSKAWPGVQYCVYHVSASPLLRKHDVAPSCSNTHYSGTYLDTSYELLLGRIQWHNGDSYAPPKKPATDCQPLIGKKLKQGDVIAYSGAVGSHQFSSIFFKVRDVSVNPKVEKGDTHLHLVQPDVFFFWQCFAPKKLVQPGVIAYPFPCDGYQVPKDQKTFKFKYTSAI